MSKIQVKRVGSKSIVVTSPSNIMIRVDAKGSKYVISINQINCQKLKKNPFILSINDDNEIVYDARIVGRSCKDIGSKLDTIKKMEKEVKDCLRLILEEVDRWES